MKFNTNLRGGRRHFHVILFIVILLSINTINSTKYTNPPKSSTLSSEISSTSTSSVEYRSPEEIQIDKLYNLITKVSPIKDELERKQLASAVYTYGTQYSIDPLLLLAIARVESNFRKTIVGYGNCVGYFQINLNVHKVSKNFKNDVNEQAKKACEILSYCKKISKNNQLKTLNRYNGNSGTNNPYANKIIKYYQEYKILYKEM